MRSVVMSVSAINEFVKRLTRVRHCLSRLDEKNAALSYRRGNSPRLGADADGVRPEDCATHRFARISRKSRSASNGRAFRGSGATSRGSRLLLSAGIAALRAGSEGKAR